MATNNSTNTSNPISLAQGGTGATSQSDALSAVLGASAVPIANGGTGATSQGAALTAILGASTVGVASGGTGAATFTSHGILLGNATSAVTASSELANGQLLIGSTGNPPVAATLIAGAGMSVTNGAGSITLAVTGGGTAWTAVSGTSATLVANNGYISNNVGATTYTTPASPALGDEYVILSATANAGFIVVQAAATQTIRIGNQITSAAGSLTGTAIGDALTLVCVVAGSAAVYQVVSSVGNFTVA